MNYVVYFRCEKVSNHQIGFVYRANDVTSLAPCVLLHSSTPMNLQG
jgi:hypothetical protein